MRSRLDLFLPELKAANESLKERVEKEGFDAVNVEAIDEFEQHIEMVSVED